MSRRARISLFLQIVIIFQTAGAHADFGFCRRLLEVPKVNPIEWAKAKLIDKTLDVMAAVKGLPKYLALIEESRRTGSYRKLYANFGEMGMAEIGIAVRYSQAQAAALKTGRPLIIVANHHLGIADGLVMQYLASLHRKDNPSLLFLARWIEKLLPHAVYGDEHRWGTAVPVEINKPKKDDPNYEAKMAEVKSFNSSWSRTATRVLRSGGALIVFPAGHVASVNAGESYPAGVYDAEKSWQDGFLDMARLGKADIVFAHVDAVNSRAFYRDRKRFGGGDKERVIWFFNEALAKKGTAIDVYLSKPMSLEETYATLAREYGRSPEALKADRGLTTELMRQFTYDVAKKVPQKLDAMDAPAKSTLLPSE